jgi:hypothetical protein
MKYGVAIGPTAPSRRGHITAELPFGRTETGRKTKKMQKILSTYPVNYQHWKTSYQHFRIQKTTFGQ